MGHRTPLRRIVLVCGTALFTGLAACPAHAAAAPTVTSGSVVAISADGTVLGSFDLSNGNQVGGLLSRDGRLRLLSTPADVDYEIVRDVNARHEVVGILDYTDGSSRAAVWDCDGKLRLLPGASSANGINASGEIVGTVGDQPVRWSPNGTMTRLPLPSGVTNGTANGVADNGTISGAVEIPQVGDVPVVWSPSGQLTRLTIPADWETGSADHVNNAGESIGLVEYGAPDVQVASARWSPDGQGGLVEDGGGWAYGINNRGVVVGDAYNAVEWEADGTKVTLPTPPGTQASSTSADAVNDAGDIAGSAYTTDGEAQELVEWTHSGKIIDLYTFPPFE